LSDAAARLVENVTGERNSDKAHEVLLTKPFNLQSMMLKHEGALIKKALAQSNGSVTHAASLLGMSYQALALCPRLPTQKPSEKPQSSSSPHKENPVAKRKERHPVNALLIPWREPHRIHPGALTADISSVARLSCYSPVKLSRAKDRSEPVGSETMREFLSCSNFNLRCAPATS
jgi:hypothetical protein